LGPYMKIQGRKEKKLGPYMKIQGRREKQLGPFMKIQGRREKQLGPYMKIQGRREKQLGPYMKIQDRWSRVRNVFSMPGTIMPVPNYKGVLLYLYPKLSLSKMCNIELVI